MSHSRSRRSNPVQFESKPQVASTCPICNVVFYNIDYRALSEHVDACLTEGIDGEESSTLDQTLNNAFFDAPKLKSSPVSPIVIPVQSIPTCAECNITDGHLTQCSKYVKRISSFSPTLSPHPTIYDMGTNEIVLFCCYLGCGKKTTIGKFPNHVIEQHSEDSQCYACPICKLMDCAPYKINHRTNLLQHLHQIHPDMIDDKEIGEYKEESEGDDEDILFDEEEDFQYNPADFGDDVKLPDKSTLGFTYREDFLKGHVSGECTICFEDFIEGACVARMDCFCVFHKTCIDLWFQKAKQCPLHAQ